MLEMTIPKLDTRMETALAEFERVPFRQLENCLRAMAQLGDDWPKKSKSLTTNLRKELFSSLEPRTAVLTVHLYFDHILSLALRRGGVSRARLDRVSFFERLRRIEVQGLFGPALVLQLRTLNHLRNQFAHNLFFDMADWDPFSFSWVRAICKRIPSARKYRRLKNLIIFKIAMMKLYQELHQEQRWLYLEDVPGKRPRRGEPP
jgi:hypothetical protein